MRAKSLSHKEFSMHAPSRLLPLLFLLSLGWGTLASAQTPGAFAQIMTDQQLIALGAATRNIGHLADEIANNDYPAIAVYWNELASLPPTSAAYWVWRTSVTRKEIQETTTVPDNTTWSWTIHMSQPTNERDTWRDMFVDGPINPSNDNIRSGIAAIYPTGGQRTHLLRMGRREARRVEQLFATGTGSTGSPGKMSYEGTVDVPLISRALQLTAP
jgi:hypothetical protein